MVHLLFLPQYPLLLNLPHEFRVINDKDCVTGLKHGSFTGNHA